MADSTQNSSSEGNGSATGTTQPGGDTPGTEADQIEEWVFTLNSATGEVAKVERIEQASNQRQEVSDEEYTALFGYMDPSAAYYAAYGYDPTAVEAAQRGYEMYEAGYYQALADYQMAAAYEMTLTSMGYGGTETAYTSGYSPEEEASYMQGMLDYEALLG